MGMSKAMVLSKNNIFIARIHTHMYRVTAGVNFAAKAANSGVN